MAAEIAEQPEAVRRTLEVLEPLRDRIAELATGRDHVLFVGRGSSDTAVYGRYLLETGIRFAKFNLAWLGGASGIDNDGRRF